MGRSESPGTAAFRACRDFLLRERENYDEARRGFQWPELTEFNWALDWFDVLATEHPDRPALWVVSDDKPEVRLTYARLSARSDQVACWLHELGVRRGEVLLTMLGNVPALWEVMLGAMKLGAVIIAAPTLLGPREIEDRVVRGAVRHLVVESSKCDRVDEAGLSPELNRIVVGAEVPAWHNFAEADVAPTVYRPTGVTQARDPLLRYFTSGTTARSKLVEHSHASYTVGHLTTMYWNGLQPGDVHLTISSPGWGQHGWRNVYAFGQWNAGATSLVYDHGRFSVPAMFDVIARCGVTTFCAPPTVWRLILQSDLGGVDVHTLRECVAAGEPLNPEVISRIRQAWGLTIRDGYGQTETTTQISNTPGQPVKPGSMGRALPGYSVALLDETTGEPRAAGEICLPLGEDRPLGLMNGFSDDPELTAKAMRGGYYHTGDVARVDDDGYFTYIGRADDVFKSSDYRISPFELESVLLEHEAVADAAVVASPDPRRQAVPKAFVVCAAGHPPSPDTARAILSHARARLTPYQWVRRLEFAELPKTATGKIRRGQLRAAEAERFAAGERTDPGTRGSTEFWEDDFPELGSPSDELF